MRLFVASLIFVTWISNGFAITQKLLFGSVIFYSIGYKLILFFLLSAHVLFLISIKKGRLRVEENHRNYIFYWLIYSFVSIVFIKYINDYPFSYILFAFWVLFFYLIIFSLVSYCGWHLEPQGSQLRVRNYILTPIIVCFSAIIILLGVLQGIFQEALINIDFSSDGYLITKSLDFIGGGYRAHSIFYSGMAFGEFSTFLTFISISALCSSYVSRKYAIIKKVFIFLMLFVTLYSSYLSLTRNIYLLNLIGISYLILNYYTKRSALSWQLFSFLIPIISLALVPTIISLVSSEEVLDTKSLFARFAHWTAAWGLFSEGTDMQKIFGLGLISNDRFEHTSWLIFDNLPLAILMYSGVTGLIFTLILLFYVQRFVLENFRNNEISPVLNAVSAFWFCLPTTSLLNVNLNTPLLLICFALSYYGFKKPLNGIKRTQLS